MWVHVELKVEKQKVEGSLTGRYVIEENRKGDHTVYSKHHRFLDMKKEKWQKLLPCHHQTQSPWKVWTQASFSISSYYLLI